METDTWENEGGAIIKPPIATHVWENAERRYYLTLDERGLIVEMWSEAKVEFKIALEAVTL